MTPVIVACASGFTSILQRLLEYKFAVNSADNKSKTGLHHAIENRQDHMIMYLCDRPDVDVTLLDVDGNNCFHYLAKTPCTNSTSEIIKELLARGASINERNLKGESPLYVSLVSGMKSSLNVFY